MFGNKKTPGADTSVGLSSNSSAINTLVEGTNIEGQITASSDLRIDGYITGNIRCEGKLIIGPTGKIDGTVYCQNAVIEGNFKGELTVNDILDVRESASVQGEIKTAKLLVQNGASFNGNCDMGTRIKNISSNAEASAS